MSNSHLPKDMDINGNHLISWGFKPSKEFPKLIQLARQYARDGLSVEQIRVQLETEKPAAPIRVSLQQTPAPLAEAIAATCDADRDNITAVRRYMNELLCAPVIRRGAVMPDACPAGAAPATIPVGGVIEVLNAIIPSAHSADICCSMFATFFPKQSGDSIEELLPKLTASTRFGMGGRPRDKWIRHPVLDEKVWSNPFLTGLQDYAAKHMGDQGDGNHFAYLGEFTVHQEFVSALAKAGHAELSSQFAAHMGCELNVLVTHHGSRGLGAQLYKRGQMVAIRHTKNVAENVPAAAAWLDYATEEGQQYWEALQYVARWTRANHQVIHNAFIAKLDGVRVIAEFGNEHNFVWKHIDPETQQTLFLHGKGATPAWIDSRGKPLLGLIPLNMAAPILIVLGANNPKYLSFAPHGAGRNFSRSHTLRSYAGRETEALAEATKGIKIHWYYGKADLSESPLGYKSAIQVESQIQEFGLASVIGKIRPLGCIMAGDAGPAPWKRKRDELSPKERRTIEHKAERRKVAQALALSNDTAEDWEERTTPKSFQ